METGDLFPKMEKWMGQLALEIVFAEAGKDAGQVPIRALLAELCAATESVPEFTPFRACATFALKKIDAIMESFQPFSPESLQLFSSLLEQLKTLRAHPQAAFVPPEETKASTAARAVAASASSSKEESSIVIAEIADAALLRDFLTEAAEHLESIEQGILQLEENPKHEETLHSVFRSFHTLKGGAGFLNLMPVQHLAHQLESLLDLARQHKLSVTAAVIDLILEGRDIINKYIFEIQLQLSEKTAPAPIHIPTQPLIERIDAAMRQKPVSQTQDSGDDAPPEEARIERVSSNVIKVDTQKLDALFDMVGEMVITQSLIEQDADILNIRSQKLSRNLGLLARITNELQKTAMSLRMVPIRATFQKMNRVMRDVAAKSEKEVELALLGEDTELDRTIVEKMSDPLIHMVRNAVDHGIESSEVRRQKGKPTAGRVTLNAFHQSGNVVIQIQDDGAGLDPQKILLKALEKGLVATNEKFTEAEIFNFIFLPGFSTAEKITEISGRGVGMDVVKKNIENLRGRVMIESVLGKGSTFNIYLPLTLAIIEGLIVGVADQRYILPTLSVKESFRPSPGMLSTVQQRGELLNVRGRLLPLTRLDRLFGLPPRTTDPCDAISVVVESMHQQRCLMVDELLGKQEVVIKSLTEPFKRNPYLAGAAILGDGRVGLILDTATLVNGN